MKTKKKIERNAADCMPKGELACKILLERANKMAENAEEIKQVDTVHYIRFRLGNNEYYGIPYQNVQEVIDNVSLTKIPCVHESIAGVINYRGLLLNLVDLKKFLKMNMSDYSQKIYVIVTKVNNILIGVLADNIEGINEYDKEIIKSEIYYQGNIDEKYILGLHNGITTILNIENIILDLKVLLATN